VAFVTDPCRAHSLLTALGLPAAPATFAPARDPPQAELDWEAPASPHQPTTTARPSPWPRPSWRRPTVATMTLAGPPHTLPPAIAREPAKAAASERPFVRPCSS